jgi:sugar phosphate isomerase/epimerase
MGEGLVDWALFFRILAEAKFSGPLSLHMEYHPRDEPGAMSKDIEFVRRQIQRAWAL